MEDRSSGDGHPRSAFRATAPARHFPGLHTPAPGAHEPVRPSQPIQIISTRLVAGKPGPQLRHPRRIVNTRQRLLDNDSNVDTATDDSVGKGPRHGHPFVTLRLSVDLAKPGLVEEFTRSAESVGWDVIGLLDMCRYQVGIDISSESECVRHRRCSPFVGYRLASFRSSLIVGVVMHHTIDRSDQL